MLQRCWDGQSFAAGQRRPLPVSWSSPAAQAAGTYTVKVGVFGEGWTGLPHWNDDVATFTRRHGTEPAAADHDDPDDDRRRRRPADDRHRRPRRRRPRRRRRPCRPVGPVRDACPSAPRCRATPSAPPGSATRQRSGPPTTRTTRRPAAGNPDATGLFTPGHRQLHRHDRRDHPVGVVQVGLRRGRDPRPDGQGVVVVPAQRRRLHDGPVTVRARARVRGRRSPG